MAKQVINYGLNENDGTGDALRNAMIKIVSNFDELYDLSFTGSYEDLTSKPAIPAELTDLGITDGNDGQVLTTDGDGGFTFADTASVTGYTDANVDTHLNTSSASNNQILSWTGADYDWIDAASGGGSSYTDSDAIAAVVGADLDMAGNKVLFGNVYNAVGDLPSASSYHGMFAHVHGTGKGYFAHSGSWVELANASDIAGAGLPSRTAPVGTTASLANDASANLDITGFKSYSLMSIQTDKAAWVRIYANGTSRTADASRVETSDPAPDAGVIAEVITSGAETVLISPGVMGYNMESTPTTNIPCRVTNKSGSAGTVQVTLTVLQLEA